MPEERWGERIVLSDEVHSRLKFNRRGLIGMARMSDGKGDAAGQYGSQWFITLGDCRAELDGKCTMFGRVEGDGIYNIMKIANGEVAEGTERPVYPEKIQSVEVLEVPEGEAWRSLKKREKIAQRTTEVAKKETGKKSKTAAAKKKGGKTLLSFAGDGGEEDSADVVVRPKKAKFNTALIDGPTETTSSSIKQPTSPTQLSKKRKSPEPTAPSRRSPSPAPKRRKPSFHEPTTQLPLRDPESPSRSPTPPLPTRLQSSTKSASTLEAEITALKATMKRDTAPAPQPKKKLSALESLIPATSTRGRKRPRPGSHADDQGAGGDTSSLSLLNAFKARLEGANATTSTAHTQPNGKHVSKPPNSAPTTTAKDVGADTAPDEEAPLCDLHFIANCQSCSDWADDINAPTNTGTGADDDDADFLKHSLTFEKDRLGKDLTWKRKNEEELVVIDPRERERELGIKDKKGRDREGKGGDGRERNRERDRQKGKGKERERDRARV